MYPSLPFTLALTKKAVPLAPVKPYLKPLEICTCTIKANLLFMEAKIHDAIDITIIIIAKSMHDAYLSLALTPYLQFKSGIRSF